MHFCIPFYASLKCFKRNFVSTFFCFQLKKKKKRKTNSSFGLPLEYVSTWLPSALIPLEMAVVTDLPDKQFCSLLREAILWGMSPFTSCF